MTRFFLCTTLALPLAGLPLLSGCDREVASETKVQVKDDGTVKKDETKVTESPDGTVTKTEERSIDRPEPKKEETTVTEKETTVDR